MGEPTSSRTPQGPVRPRDAVGASDRRHTRPVPTSVYRRRRLVAALGLVLVVALVVVLLAFVWPGFARSGGEVEPAPTVTVTGDPATPTLEPVERTASTPFAQALPATVLDLALRSDAATDAWTESGALEAYELVYADGEGPDATTVTVVAGQWPTPEEAENAAAALLGGAEPSTQEDVTVDGETVGTVVVVPGEGGAATVTWRNSTAVLQATGPADVVEDVYAAYPM
ncbi:hypothetical protein [Cellulosimicrobium cellulans]|uniref:hypothetical protein n=1 Tax=Cellulosimicrobium cellulans TaxID=1710 RepID=UPI0008492AA7|nr:hypothetical protein [Cellulosimicrobium cellulans]